jgi:hypothetical protein
VIGEYYEISSAEAILRSGLAPCSSARLARWAQRMRCPACFHDNPMGVSTCVSCGQPLAASRHREHDPEQRSKVCPGRPADL